jgi:histone-lysine N-methyltransferase ASH1L
MLWLLCFRLRTSIDVFVGDSAEFWKKSKRLEHSTCICEPTSGCDENCFNRFMFYECDNSNCNIGVQYCTNRSFDQLRQRCKAGGKYNIGVEVIKTADRGYGVRSNRAFEPNQIIVEYTGEIITQDECDDRMKKMYKHNEVGLYVEVLPTTNNVTVFLPHGF